jgi:hypothetical protein
MNDLMLVVLWLASAYVTPLLSPQEPARNLVVGDGVVVLPDDCAGTQVKDPANPGSIQCERTSNRIVHASGIEHFTYEPPMGGDSPGIEGSLRCDMQLYWGESGRSGDEFCAVVRYPSEAAGQYLGHSFCTRSLDKRAREQVVAIALSFRRSGAEPARPCGQPAVR